MVLPHASANSPSSSSSSASTSSSSLSAFRSAHPPRRRRRRRPAFLTLLPCLCLATFATVALASSACDLPPNILPPRGSQRNLGAEVRGIVGRAKNEATSPASARSSNSTAGSSGSAAGGAATSGAGSSLKLTGSSTSSAAGVASTTVPSSYVMPRPFDTTLGTNFTSTACPSFFQTFLANPTFISCVPFSLLLSSSSAFFDAESSPNSLLPYILDASCAAPIDTCANLISSFAAAIVQPSTCGPDLAQGNPLVVQALVGFRNFNMMRQVGCQRNNATQQYCFAEAAASSSPNELYEYFLPQGTFLPSSTNTTCVACTQGLLDIYARYAPNATLPISQTYSAAQRVANAACGPSFARVVTVAKSSASSTATGMPLAVLGSTVLLAALVLWTGVA